MAHQPRLIGGIDDEYALVVAQALIRGDLLDVLDGAHRVFLPARVFRTPVSRFRNSLHPRRESIERISEPLNDTGIMTLLVSLSNPTFAPERAAKYAKFGFGTLA